MHTIAEAALDTTQLTPAQYEAPRIEAVLDAATLAREVHYAGIGSGG